MRLIVLNTTTSTEYHTARDYVSLCIYASHNITFKGSFNLYYDQLPKQWRIQEKAKDALSAEMSKKIFMQVYFLNRQDT